MTDKTDLLPMPNGEAVGMYQAWSYDQMCDYARANVAHAVAPLQAEIERLRTENERLREDAARYRWLRKGANRGANDDVAVVRGLGSMDYGMSAVVYTYSEEIDGYDLDAAIDAAMEVTP